MASRIVLISGCSTGIGLATAVLLAKDPEKRFKVYATMRNLTSKGQLEEEGKEHLGDTLMIKQMDVCSDESVNKAVQEVISEEGRIDVLFNNAGMPLLSILECIPMEMIREVFEVNYFGTLRLIRAVLPCMKARESGHIINCSSHAGIVGFPFGDIYTSSKFAVEGLTESLAPVLREFNIRCTIIEPGPVDTPMMVKVANTTGIDLSTTDPKTREIKKRVDSTFSGLCLQEGGMITAQDVAEVVNESLLSQKPALRYQTNKSFCPDEVAAKLTDISGNKSVDIIAKRYCEEGQ